MFVWTAAAGATATQIAVSSGWLALARRHAVGSAVDTSLNGLLCHGGYIPTALSPDTVHMAGARAQVCRGRRSGGLAEWPAVPGRGGARAAAAGAAAAPQRVRAIPRGARHAVLLPQGAAFRVMLRVDTLIPDPAHDQDSSFH